MSIATSAIERLQDVAGRTGAVTRADERATAAELHVPLAAVHGARPSTTIWGRPGGVAGTSVSARAQHVS